MRVRKGWQLVGTNAQEVYETETSREKKAREHKANMMIRNTVTLPEEKLIEESLKTYERRETRKAELRSALELGKLRSKRLIAEAQN